MDDGLRSFLRKLERFGAENDGRVADRLEKMLNITPETGELLAILVLATKARRVLEIGTSNGYSTLWLADAVQSISGKVVTVELSPNKAELAARNFERAGLTRLIRQEVTPAGEFLQHQSPAEFDFVFLDAKRDEYVAMWPEIQSVLAPGGMLVVDNALSHAAEMEEFIAVVQGTPGWRSVVVPIGNGEFVALRFRQ